MLSYVGAPVRLQFPELALWLRWPLMACFLFAAAQLFLVTFWGLFYLGERMLTPD